MAGNYGENIQEGAGDMGLDIGQKNVGEFSADQWFFHPFIHSFIQQCYWTSTVCQVLCRMLEIFQRVRQILSLLSWYLDSDGIVEVFIEAMSIDDLSKGVEEH